MTEISHQAARIKTSEVGHFLSMEACFLLAELTAPPAVRERQQVTTLEELAKLPPSTVIMPKGSSYAVQRLGLYWHATGRSTAPVHPHPIWFPADVLWDPREEEARS